MFAAFVEGPDGLIDALANAIRRPAFPLYLGRRACPPTLPLFLAVESDPIWEVVRSTGWLASGCHRKRQRDKREVQVRVVADAGIVPGADESTPGRTLQDVPVSFDSERRLYTFRQVEEASVPLQNPEYDESAPRKALTGGHDPMEVL